MSDYKDVLLAHDKLEAENARLKNDIKLAINKANLVTDKLAGLYDSNDRLREENAKLKDQLYQIREQRDFVLKIKTAYQEALREISNYPDEYIAEIAREALEEVEG